MAVVEVDGVPVSGCLPNSASVEAASVEENGRAGSTHHILRHPGLELGTAAYVGIAMGLVV